MPAEKHPNRMARPGPLSAPSDVTTDVGSEPELEARHFGFHGRSAQHQLKSQCAASSGVRHIL
jgi:hypothetical protein